MNRKALVSECQRLSTTKKQLNYKIIIDIVVHDKRETVKKEDFQLLEQNNSIFIFSEFPKYDNRKIWEAS